MKKLLLLFLCVYAITFYVGAQGYNILGLKFQNDFGRCMGEDYFRNKLKSVSPEYIHGFKLGKDTDSYFETGVGIDYKFNNCYATEYLVDGCLNPYDHASSDKKNMMTNLMGLTVPARLLVRFTVSRNVKITPFVGAWFQSYIVGSVKHKVFEYIPSTASKPTERYCYTDNLLRKGSPYYINRFNGGWELGVGINWKQWVGRASFGTGFTRQGPWTHDNPPEMPKLLSITVGYQLK